MSANDKRRDHIVDDSGHNFDTAVINILNELAHETTGDQPSPPTSDEIDLFFDLPVDL